MATISRRTFLRHVAVGTGAIVYLATGITVHGAGPETFRLRILHTNDHHARIEPVTGGTPPAPIHGGVARRKALIDALRNEKDAGNLILLDAGDIFQGTLWFNQYLGQADLEFYNAMGYELMTIGNHEFDRGQPPLAAFLSRITFPAISANLVIEPSSPLSGLVKPWIVKDIGGQQIGFFGLTTEETPVLSSPGPGVSFTNYIEAARRAVAELQAQGVTKIIALTHIGITFDRELARQVSGIQVIIGGHSHTPMGPMIKPEDPARPYPEVIANPDGKPVIMATDWEWGRWLGDLTVGFDANGDVTSVVAARPTEVAAALASDPGFENRINELKQPLDALRNQQVGEAAVALNGVRADVRTKETNLGNLISDAMLEKTRAAGAQVAIMNGGSIRTSIDAGPVTLGEVLEVQPFGNTITLLTLTGAQIKEALENGVSQIEQVAGRFAQVAGLRYTFNPTAPVGSRVVAVQVADSNSGYTAIDPAANYRVVTNSFLLTGGDGYMVFTQGANKVDTGFVDADVTTEYIQTRSPVSPAVEGRISEGASAPSGPVAAPTAPSSGTTAPAQRPVSLPNTGAELTPGWLVAALGASALGSGLALRRRGQRQTEHGLPVEEREVEA